MIEHVKTIIHFKDGPFKQLPATKTANPTMSQAKELIRIALKNAKQTGTVS